MPPLRVQTFLGHATTVGGKHRGLSQLLSGNTPLKKRSAQICPCGRPQRMTISRRLCLMTCAPVVAAFYLALWLARRRLIVTGVIPKNDAINV